MGSHDSALHHYDVWLADGDTRAEAAGTARSTGTARSARITRQEARA